MIILVLIAITSLILGILFLVNREFLKRLEYFLNKSITTINVGVDKYYKTIGIFFGSIFLYFINYLFVGKKIKRIVVRYA